MNVLNPARKVPILMYHRITEMPAGSLERYAVSPRSFAGQMEYLHHQGFATVSLGDLVAHYQLGRDLPRKAVAITFDDGYLDNYLYAFPTLRRYGFTATIFQVASCIGGAAEWDRVDGQLAPRLMSWKELRLLASDGITIGAHPCTHPYLTKLPVIEARREIAEAKAILEAGLGRKVEFFAYPYTEYNANLRAAVIESGFIAACSSVSGQSDAADDPFMLKRLIVKGSDTLSDFRWLLDSPHHHSLSHRLGRGKRAGVVRGIGARS